MSLNNSEILTTHDLYRTAKDMLSRQMRENGTRLVVTSDVDDTIYSHHHHHANGRAFEDYLANKHIPFAAVTGRHTHEVMEYINSSKLTRPPTILSPRNGTMIYTAKPTAFYNHKRGMPVTVKDYDTDQTYSDWISSLGFNKREILAQTQGLFDAIRRGVPTAWLEHQFADRPDMLETLGMVGDANQVIWDIELEGSRDTHDEALAHVQSVAREMFAGLSVILMEGGSANQSEYRGNGVAYGLFILGNGVGKHSAIEHIIKHTGAQAATFTGDHLNDLSALAHDGYSVPVYRGVVGGARQVLLDKLQTSPHTLIDTKSDRIASQSALYIVEEALKHQKGDKTGHFKF